MITADGSSTVGPFTTKAAEDWKADGGGDVTVGISGTGGGFERFCAGETDISNASRAIDDDESGDLRGERRRVRRAPGRDRRAHERRQPRERLGDVPDRRAAERDLEARLEGERTGTRSTRRFPDVAAQALRRGHRLGHVRLLHRRHQRRGGREPLRLLRDRGRQRHRPGRLGRRGCARLLRLLVLRGEPGHAEGARGRRRRGLRRAERRDRAGRLVHAAVAPALHVREAELARRQRGARRLHPLHARERADDRRGGAVRAAEPGADRRAAAEARGRDRRR